jgi:hypothetical protein
VRVLNPMRRFPSFFLSLGLLAVITACSPAATPTALDPNAAMTLAFATVNAQMTQTAAAQPTATATPSPVPTAVRTPPVLPDTYQTSLLNPLDTPHAYVQDTCQYLQDKWNPNNSAPGTVVMVVMFHSINKGAAEDANQISAQDFKHLMNDLHDMGFQAINTQQLADFLYTNAKIPERSVLLVVDDRHAAQNFDDHFRTYWEQWGWPVVNGWISKDDSIGRSVLPGNVALSNEGWVDYQAHGVVHNINITDSSSDEFITQEMQGSILAIQKNFGKTPIAYIWPGGGFSKRAAELGRQFGYKLGFTVNPRGPVMFNWVPLADQKDPQRPYYTPEGPVDDPLMTLPRYWDTDARSHLDTVRQIGQQAADYAQQNKATELEYYDIVCAPTYGPIPTPTP